MTPEYARRRGTWWTNASMPILLLALVLLATGMGELCGWLLAPGVGMVLRGATLTAWADGYREARR